MLGVDNCLLLGHGCNSVRNVIVGCVQSNGQWLQCATETTFDSRLLRPRVCSAARRNRPGRRCASVSISYIPHLLSHANTSHALYTSTARSQCLSDACCSIVLAAPGAPTRLPKGPAWRNMIQPGICDGCCPHNKPPASPAGCLCLTAQTRRPPKSLEEELKSLLLCMHCFGGMQSVASNRAVARLLQHHTTHVSHSAGLL